MGVNPEVLAVLSPLVGADDAAELRAWMCAWSPDPLAGSVLSRRVNALHPGLFAKPHNSCRCLAPAREDERDPLITNRLCSSTLCDGSRATCLWFGLKAVPVSRYEIIKT
jgi:hypothetical protein